MANHEPFPSDNTNTGEKIPHTGKLSPEEGGEYPVREYKETSLQDAHDQKLLEVPDTLEDAHGRGLLPDPATVVRTAPETTPSRSRSRNMLIAAGTGAAALAAVVGLAIGKSGGDSSNEHKPDRPVATATSNVDPTPEAEPLPDHPPVVSVKTHPNPADAIKALEELKLEFISGNSPYYEYYLGSDNLDREQYANNYLTSIYGTSNREDPIVDRTANLEAYYDQINSELKQFFGEKAQYKITLDKIEIVHQKGNTITYRASYKINTDDIPAEYQDKAIELVPNNDQKLVEVTLLDQDGNWVIGAASNPEEN